MLYEFPVRQIKFNLPKWVRALPYENEFVQNIMVEVREGVKSVSKMSEHDLLNRMFNENEFIDKPVLNSLSLADGTVYYDIPVSSKMFYKLLSEDCGVEISDDFYLMSFMKHLTHAKQEYDKIKFALEQVKEKGYGVVTPTLSDMTLEEPQIIKKGSGSIVKLRASAPSTARTVSTISANLPFRGTRSV